MKLRGRRHWRHTVDIVTGTPGTGPHAGTTVWENDPNRANQQAAVQSMDRASAVRHGLDTTVEHFWVRVDETAGPITPSDTALEFGSLFLIVTSVNHVPGEDFELIATVGRRT